MDNLVDKNGEIDFGLIKEPVDRINHMDYDLRTPMGRPRSRLAKKMLFKQFHFIGVNAPDFMAGAAVVDLKYAANGFFYVFDKKEQTLTETKKTTLPSRARISLLPEEGEAIFESGSLYIRLNRHHVFARSRTAVLDADLMSGETSPLRICTRTGFRGWTYTRKTAPIPMSGSLTVNGRICSLTPASSLGLTDWTAGYLRRETYWNWAAIAALTPEGRRLGLNLSCGVNETGITENAFWIDNQSTKVDTVKFAYGGRRSGDAWHIESADGKVSLDFKPLGARREHINALAVVSRFSQYIGRFSGTLLDDAGRATKLFDCPGWTEEHFSRW